MAPPQKRRADGRGDDGPNKKARQSKSQSRSAWARDSVNRRARNDATQQKRAEQGEAGRPIYAIEFSKEEIEAEERKPKKKVAIMFGYSGSGFSGLQLTNKERTIEGELFMACVNAGTVSKANADDPKKISWIRCARTDKGVHAAGNVVSAKLIVEEDGVASRINSKLPPEIRVWGVERTVSSFSAYQFVDSRVYEFLIPTHCFLPPHPRTFLGQQLERLAQKAGDEENFKQRQSEVLQFWAKAEEDMQPAREKFEPNIWEEALNIMFSGGLQSFKKMQTGNFKTENAKHENEDEADADGEVDNKASGAVVEAVKSVKQAYRAARLAYRIDAARLERVRRALGQFVGTHSYHNYTVKKKIGDPSAKRHMKSFAPADKPILINGTEWLSLKVHGQSFMMHQIRKMVFMAAMVVRCGAEADKIMPESFTCDRVNIPKAPGLGLLLEKPVFDMYNERRRGGGEHQWAEVSFVPYQKEIDEFKQREIYERIYREEEQDGVFYYLWASVDSLKSSQLLYLSSMGVDAVKDEELKKDGDVVDDIVFDDENEEQADS